MIDKVVYIGGVARSGTSWIGQIFNSCPSVRFRFQPLFSYEFREKVNEDSDTENFQVFFNELFNNESEFLTQQDKISKGLYPDFSKSNESILAFKENRFQSIIEPMLRKCENVYFVGVIRNPNAMLYSWTQNEKEFPPGSDIIKEWRFGNCKNKGSEDYFGYYKWKEVANLYLDLKQKYPERVFLIHYDKFLNDSIKLTQNLFKEIELPFTEKTLNFLSDSANRKDENYYSVYKGGVDKDVWKKYFPKQISSEIQADLMGTRLEQFLY